MGTDRSLNKYQFKASQWTIDPDSHLLLTAGAGTGKTRVIIERIRYLLSNNIDPNDILVLTFTTKACNEIKERLKGIDNLPLIATFHSSALHILKQKGQEIDPMDQYDEDEIIQMMIKVKDIKLSLSKVRLRLSLSQNNIVKDELLDEYINIKREHNKYDYEDLLIKVINLKDINKYKYILVDEFQDATLLQIKYINKILDGQLFAVGDPRQSIYGFRGSFPNVFDKIRQYYPKISSLSLVKNYRSSDAIINSSNRLFSEYDKLKKSGIKGSVSVIKVLSEYTMASYILNDIAERIGALSINDSDNNDKGYDLKDFAILFRHHRQKNIVLRYIKEKGLPYELSGEVSPFHEPEVKFLIDSLRLIKDEGGLNNIIRYITKYKDNRYIGIKLQDIESTKSKELRDWYEAFKEFRREIENDLNSISSSSINYLCKIDKTKDQTSVMEFLNWAERSSSLSKLLLNLEEYIINNYYDPLSSKITLTTIHSAKGLEFRVVYIIDFDTHTFTDSDEDKRIFYVALTRAKEDAIILYSKDVSSLINVIKEDIDLVKDPLIQKQLKKKEINKERRSQIGLL